MTIRLIVAVSVLLLITCAATAQADVLNRTVLTLEIISGAIALAVPTRRPADRSTAPVLARRLPAAD